MRRLSPVAGSLVVIVFSGLVANCDDPKTKNPLTPVTATVASVEISGPSSVAPGQSVQFNALVHTSTGAEKLAATPNARWFSSNPGVLQVNGLGLASAGQVRSEVILTVEVPGPTNNATRRSSREILVLPNGTYRMVGVVSDAEFLGSRLAGARVEVLSGTPLVTTTDSNGQYRLYGVPPDADIQITRAGYNPVVQSVHLTGNATQNFQLTVSGPRPNLSGNYTLAIDVSSCPGTIPLAFDLLHRQYEAVLTQSGPTVQVALTEPRFRTNSLGRGNHFSGDVDAAGATFLIQGSVSYYYFYYGPIAYPEIAERLSDGTYFVVGGSVTTTLSSGVLSGDMNGFLERWDSKFPNGNLLGACYQSVPRFTLTPR